MSSKRLACFLPRFYWDSPTQRNQSRQNNSLRSLNQQSFDFQVKLFQNYYQFHNLFTLLKVYKTNHEEKKWLY